MVRPWWIAYAALAVVIVLVSYVDVQGLGLYEDDYLFSRTWGDSWSDVFHEIGHALEGGECTGRPLGIALMCFLFRLGGGLSGCYFLGFLIQCLNGLLILLLLLRCFGARAAFAGAVFFSVYPGDSAKFLLVRSFHVLPAVTLFLLSALLYQRGLRLLPYACYLVSLLVYEIAAVPFFFLPFLPGEPARNFWRDVLSHCLKTCAVVLLVLAWRIPADPGRLSEVADLGMRECLQRVVVAVTSGPATVVRALLKRPLESLPWPIPISVAVGLATTLLVWAVLSSNGAGEEDRPPPLKLAGLARWSLPGLAMWISSYAVMITADRFPPTFDFGRLTSVHSGGTLGATIVFAAGVEWLSQAANRNLRQEYAGWGDRVLTCGLGLYLGLLANFETNMQMAFVAAWDRQKAFWTSLTQLAPDLEQDTVILVRIGRFRDDCYQAYPWCAGVVLSQVLALDRWPAAHQPFLMFAEDAERHSRRVGERVFVEPVPGLPERELFPNNVIVLEPEQSWDRLRRDSRGIRIQEVCLPVKEQGRGTDLPPGLLARHLLPAP